MTKAGFLAAAIAATFIAPTLALAEQDALSASQQAIIVTSPNGDVPVWTDVTNVIRDNVYNTCGEGVTSNCLTITPVQDVTFFKPLTKNCQLAPCLPGCPGAAALMCAPPLMKTMTFTRGQSVHFDEAVKGMDFFDAQGGGEVGVFTFEDGSHEAYYVSQETGFSLIEAGGGGGGHQQLLDDIRSQWAAN